MMMGLGMDEAEEIGVAAEGRGAEGVGEIRGVTLEALVELVMRTSMAKSPASLPRWWRRQSVGQGSC